MGEGGSRTNFHGSDEDLHRTLDDCVRQSLPECTDALKVMVKYFCGTSDECNQHSSQGKTNWDKVAISAEIAKKNILREFFFIGMLEKFDDTLAILESILPDYFDGAREVMASPEVAKKRAKSKSKKTATYLNETKTALEHGILVSHLSLSIINNFF